MLFRSVQRLVKSLPQKLRHRIGPAPEFAERFAGAVDPGEVTLVDAIARYARGELNLVIPSDAFRPETLPAHLALNYRVVDEHGRQLAMGRNLAALRTELGSRALEQFSAIAKPAAARSGITTWDFGELEEIMEVRQLAAREESSTASEQRALDRNRANADKRLRAEKDRLDTELRKTTAELMELQRKRDQAETRQIGRAHV